MAQLPLSFRDRFAQFATTIPNSECIDNLTQTNEQREAKKADFFFKKRTIICELKNLETDTSGKIEKLLKPLERRPEWPLYYGGWDLSKILRKFPDGAEINRQVFEAITTAINKAVAGANRQIRATKRTFGLPESGGLLVLANETIHVLSPQVIAHKVHRMLNKRRPDGTPQFPEINTVWMIVENYVWELKPGVTGIPALILQQDIADPANVQSFVEELQQGWAAFHNVPLVTIEGATLDDTNFRKNPNLERRPQQEDQTRANLWRQEYDANPYLQHLSSRRLIRYAGRLFAQISPGLLKGCSDVQKARSTSMRLWRLWTHFLQEVNRRGMDMRDIAPAIRPIKRRLRLGNKIEPLSRLGRNDLCPCASGKKFKHCHGRQHQR